MGLSDTEFKIAALEDWLIEQGTVESELTSLAQSSTSSEEYLDELSELALLHAELQNLSATEIATLPLFGSFLAGVAIGFISSRGGAASVDDFCSAY